MSIPSLIGLWLIHPDLVLTSFFTGLGLSFMFMFIASSTVHYVCHQPLHWVILSLSFPLFIITFSQFACVFVSAVSDMITLPCSIGTTCIKISSNHPVAFFICDHRYYSMVIGMLCLCFMFCVISLPVFMTWMMYEHPPWSLFFTPSKTHCIPRILSYHCTAAVDLTDKKMGLCEYHHY